MLFFLFFCCLTILWIFYRWIFRDKHKFASKFPGPWGLPFFGPVHLLFLVGSSEKLISLVSKILRDYETPFTTWMGGYFFLTISKPEDASVVLNSRQCLNKQEMYDVLRNIMGDGLLSINNPAWKKHRKCLNPCFSPTILQSFVPIFNQEAKILLTRLDQQADHGEIFNVYEYLSACTLDMVCKTTMDTQVHAQKMDKKNIDGKKMIKVIDEMLSISAIRLYKIWYHIKWLYKMTSMCKTEENNSKYFFAFIKNIWNNKRNELTINTDEKTIKNDAEISKTTPEIFIKQMFKLHGDQLNEWEVISEIATVIVGGLETAALSMTYCLLMLAMHPEIQENVYEEVKRVFPSKKFSVDFEDLKQLEYTERVIKEAMRLFPAGPFISRINTEPFQFRGTTVPVGTNIIIAIFGIHRDEKIWGPQAKQFHPDHFLPENIEKMHPYSFIPFSAGARNCIGFRYAMISMRIIIAQIMRQFKLTTKLKMEDLKLSYSTTLKLNNKFMISFERRNG